MEALSNIPSNGPAKEIGSIAGRALASFGHEMDQLLAALSPNAPAPSHLGQNIDVKARTLSPCNHPVKTPYFPFNKSWISLGNKLIFLDNIWNKSPFERPKDIPEGRICLLS